jgi:predicted RNA binding protein YcfA (HicA-like mRNA interferase family)
LGKLRVLSAAQVCQILEQYDFVQVRQRGSHIIMQQRLPNTTVTVPVPNYSEIKIALCSLLFGSQDYLDIFLK